MADVERTLVLAILLVVLVVFVFLRSARTTIIPGVAVPLSLLGTFGAMYFLGYSLDNLSLMALTISTGFVVDDAIVVIENVNRHLANGLAPIEAALVGAKEIGFTVVSMSASLIAVFIPILLMGGLVGRLFREFSVTLSVAVAVSMVVSLTTTPMMCAHLLRPESESRHGRLYKASERAFDGLLRAYDRSLTWMLRRWQLTLAIAFATVAVNVALYIAIPKGFFPQQDTGMLSGTVQAPQDTSYHGLSAMMTDFVHTLLTDPAIDTVVAFTGGGGTGANSARMFISLKPLAVRKEHADAVIARLRRRSAESPGPACSFRPCRISASAAEPAMRSISSHCRPTISTTSTTGHRFLRHGCGRHRAHRCQQRSGESRSPDDDCHRPRRRRSVGHSGPGDRRSALRCVRPAAGLDHLHVAQSVSRRDGGGARLPGASRRPAADLRAVDVRQPRAVQHVCHVSTGYRAAIGEPSVAISRHHPDLQSERGRVPLRRRDGDRRRHARPRRAGDRARRISGNRQVFQSSLASEPWLILAALLTVYIVLGISTRA